MIQLGDARSIYSATSESDWARFMFFDARLGGTCEFTNPLSIRKAPGSTPVTSRPDAQNASRAARQRCIRASDDNGGRHITPAAYNDGRDGRVRADVKTRPDARRNTHPPTSSTTPRQPTDLPPTIFGRAVTVGKESRARTVCGQHRDRACSALTSIDVRRLLLTRLVLDSHGRRPARPRRAQTHESG